LGNLHLGELWCNDTLEQLMEESAVCELSERPALTD